MENINDRVELQVRDRAFNRRLFTFAILNKAQHIDIELFLKDAFYIYQPELHRFLDEHNMVKSMTILTAEFEKSVSRVNNNENGNSTLDNNASSENEKIKQTLYFATSNKLIAFSANLNEHYQENVIDEIIKNVHDTAIRGSGFTLARIIELNVQISSYQPLNGSSYIKTPKELASKKALINVKNEHDEMCFKWAVLSALHPIERNPQKVQNYYDYRNELNFDGINFPVSLKDIDKFTRQNEKISINVYYYDKKKDKKKSKVSPLRVSSDVKENHIHLLLLMEDKKCNGFIDQAQTAAERITAKLESGQIHTHYCWIKNLSRLVNHQLSKHGHQSFICDRCLNYFQQEEKLKRHSINCTNGCRIEMPDENDKWIQFKNHKNQLKAPFVIYADTEAFLKRMTNEEKYRVFNEKCSTSAYQEHNVYSVGYYLKCEFNDSYSFYATSGNRTDCIEWFINELETISNFVSQLLMKNEPITDLSLDEELAFQDPTTVCCICNLPFQKHDLRVHDHCHFTGKYRGPAHNCCNLNYQNSRTIPVVMHNLSGYDAHLFIRKLATQMNGDITIIPNNSEQYISFTKIVENSSYRHNVSEKIKLKFIDSCRFMAASLSELASLLPSHKKRILYAECQKNYSSEQMLMLERKGVFPYDFVDNLQRLDEISLPSREQFYSELNEEGISDEDYEFACQIWEKFHIKTLGEYSELYLKTDVLLLADVFENFRDLCHTIYKLDPAHYFTSPGIFI